MSFGIHGIRAHGYTDRSGRKQGINDGRKVPIARWYFLQLLFVLLKFASCQSVGRKCAIKGQLLCKNMHRITVRLRIWNAAAIWVTGDL